ncbi:MAG: hypothetical protein MUO18_08370, partial [Methanomassiliicoccales archaeon]|nr:hypothetical protein [Methanomassiliicoccales archaeon]
VAVSHIHLDHGGGVVTLLKRMPKYLYVFRISKDERVIGDIAYDATSAYAKKPIFGFEYDY